MTTGSEITINVLVGPASTAAEGCETMISILRRQSSTNATMGCCTSLSESEALISQTTINFANVDLCGGSADVGRIQCSSLYAN